MNLNQYLVAINEKTPINLKRFLALLAAQDSSNWRRIFSASKVSKDKHQLTVIDNQCFARLLQSTKSSNNRVEAAKSGDSHQQNTSMSFLLVYPNAFDTSIKRENLPPKVAVMANLLLNIAFSPQKTLVIIENQENFFRYQEFLPQLLTKTEQVDIAFAQGNSITNALNAIYFDQYHHILCCFDYDLGGLTMFSSLTKLTTAKVSFILPSKTDLHSEDFLKTHFKKTPEQDTHWQKAINLAEQFGLHDLAHAFNIRKKFMEQEVYLSDNIFCLKKGKR